MITITRDESVAGFILAGGKSSRMGTDKGLLEFEGVPLVLRQARMLAGIAASVTVIGDPARYGVLGLDVQPDIASPPGEPHDYIRGIITALEITPARWSLIIPVDLPFLTEPWLRFLVEEAIVRKVDMVVGGACWVYQKRSLDGLLRSLREGARSLGQTMTHLSYHVVPKDERRSFDSDGMLLKDIDTPDAYRAALEVLKLRALRVPQARE